MNDWALYLGMAALLVAACAVLGALFGHIWGIDASRYTPGRDKSGAACMMWMGRTMSFAAILPMALWMCAAMSEVLGAQLGALACMVYALACSMLSFAAMYASVRNHSRGMSAVCERWLFPHSGKIRLLLGLTAMLLGAGAMLMSITRMDQVMMSNGRLFLFASTLWPVIGLQMTANCLACMIQSESQILLCASMGPVGAALVAMFTLLPGAEMSMNPSMVRVIEIGVMVIWAISWMMLCRAGGVALQNLLENPKTGKQPRLLPMAVICGAVSVPLAALADTWLFTLVPIICVIIVLLDIVACCAWFIRDPEQKNRTLR